MLTGYMPWSAESTTQMLIAHMYVEPEPLPPLSGLPADVMEVCQACLEKDPADRPAAADVAEVLAAAATALERGTKPVPAGRVRWGPKAAAAARRRRGRQLAMAAAAAAVIVAAVVTAAVARPDTSRGGDSAAVATQGGPAADPGESAGVGAVGGPSGGPTSRRPGEPLDPGVVDPREAGQPTVTTSAPPGDPGATATPTTPPPDPVDGTSEHLGNTVTMRCVGAAASIVATTPADGWAVRREESGPTAVRVRFRSDSQVTTFRGGCANGAPQFSWKDG
jgi:serine/threonine-protein kinase